MYKFGGHSQGLSPCKTDDSGRRDQLCQIFMIRKMALKTELQRSSFTKRRTRAVAQWGTE
jgi:hypothetical protein